MTRFFCFFFREVPFLRCQRQQTTKFDVAQAVLEMAKEIKRKFCELSLSISFLFFFKKNIYSLQKQIIHAHIQETTDVATNRF